ncbi:MAG TPA: D-glucuronyl C5-epimerase family protein [Ktedonobacteraceae bacterium]|nr:D-glucuronyl C5-epimerase family protein [Ktedonobacteraceae bacterium]
MQTEKANSGGARLIAPSAPVLAPYPVDMSKQGKHKADYPTTIAQEALVHWEHYLASGDAAYARAFLARAQWLVEHEARTGERAGGWPISLPHTALSPVSGVGILGKGRGADGFRRGGGGVDGRWGRLRRPRGGWGVSQGEQDEGDASVPPPPNSTPAPTERRGPRWRSQIPTPKRPAGGAGRQCLSALTQGIGLSVLIRAYQLTSDRAFLEAAQRVVHTFELDILDGGVSTPVGNEGVFFEEIAIYPAAHMLNGFIFALFGLYDYLKLTGDTRLEKLIQSSLATLHKLLDEFDSGFWTYSDLGQRHLSCSARLAEQSTLLAALATCSDCVDCAALAARWEQYRHKLIPRLRYVLSRGSSFVGNTIWSKLQKRLFPQTQVPDKLRVCIPVPAFPVMGGVLTFLDKVASVTTDIWQREYLTQHIGPDPRGYVIHRFGSRRMTPLYFPFAWLYVLAGIRKLVSLLRGGAGYHVILAQDGVFTGAFAAIAAKLTGRRVVCIDHGDLSLLIERNSALFRAERLREVVTKPWPWPIRLAARRLLALYWPSRLLMARVAARFVDHYLIPGVSDDGVDALCERLGVRPSSITRFTNMIEIERHIIPNAETRIAVREKNGIAADALVIAIVCRLSAEKGLEIALEAIKQAISTLAVSVGNMHQGGVRVIIAGDGPLRQQLEKHIAALNLREVCILWGEAPVDEVITVLGISDIFLYTSWRGAGYPLAILEAMASGCAVVASTEPIANAYLLTEGRGIAVPPGDVAQTSAALVRLLSNREGCHQMGQLARSYVAQYHSPAVFRRTLQRATHWAALDELCRGAIHCALGRESTIHEGAMNCAPTHCAIDVGRDDETC